MKKRDKRLEEVTKNNKEERDRWDGEIETLIIRQTQ